MKKKVGIFVGENGHWGFFREIFANLSTTYQTTVFQPPTYTLPLLSGRLNRWSYAQQMRALLQRTDVCFFEWASELLKAASHLPASHRPLVARLHSYEIYVWAPQIQWEAVDRIIFVSHYVRRKFLAQFPEQASKTCVIYNGVDLTRFQPPPVRDFRFTIGMLCNIHPVKRIYETIFTIANLKRLGYQPHLHIAGGKWPGGHFDDYYAAIERLIDKLDVREEVTLHGPTSTPERWLQEIDIFLSNSYWEGQQVALLEAMATGCYTLSHFWDGAEDILPAECLFGAETELQQKLIAYAELPAGEKQQRCAQLRALARDQFDIRTTTQAIRNVIEEVSSRSQ
ncbi:MAG: glycosyltransferase family 4 protein [Caldilineaceae bacterium]